METIRQNDAAHIKQVARRPRNVGKRRVGMDFERKVKEAFEGDGFTVYHRGKDAGYFDGGIDLVATKGVELLLIQCKYLGKNKTGPRKGRRKQLGERTIFEFIGALAAFDRTYPKASPFRPIICTNSIATPMGKQVADLFGIEMRVIMT